MKKYLPMAWKEAEIIALKCSHHLQGPKVNAKYEWIMRLKFRESSFRVVVFASASYWIN